MNEVVAAFDFDGTLTTGGSVWNFLVSIRGTRKVLAGTVALAPRLAWGALKGGTAADSAKEALFVRTLGGLDAKVVEERARAFGEDHYRRHLRRDVRERLEWHKKAGHHVLVVSASPAVYVRSAGYLLGVDSAVCTELEVGSDGKLTGRYSGANCRGEQKLLRVNEWIAQNLSAAKEDRPVIWAYGNSRGDIALLKGADFGVDAGRLGRLGKLRGFAKLNELPSGR